MKMRNYCAVIMGETENAVEEIQTISETKVNLLNAKGIVITTFSSFVSPGEITDWLVLNNRNFLVFELTPENSGFFFTRKDILDGLFGFLLKSENLKEKSDELESIIKSEKGYFIVKEEQLIPIEEQLTEDDIYNMSRRDKDSLMNQLMDKGVENLSDFAKKILPLLAK